MQLTIVGTGTMARAVTMRALAGGHHVDIGALEPLDLGFVAPFNSAAQLIADAKALVSQSARDGGQRPIDAGALARARELEALGYLHMAVQPSLGTFFSSAVVVVP